jgi:hypothetical protein
MVRSRAQLLRRLAHLAAFAVQGTLVQVSLRCGTASCGCHRNPDRRHGPHGYLKFRDPAGRATALYVPRAHAQEADQAVRAWRELGPTLVALGQLNRQALRARLRRRPDAAAGR